MLRTTARLVALVLALLAGALGTLPAAAADDAAASFVAKANAERRARGLTPYAVKADLAAVAARHSARMAQRQTLYHNPALGSEVGGWQVVGENVGTGGSVESIHAAFMKSPSHRANILGRDYSELGVGTVTDADGVLWVTQVFRLPVRTPAPAPRESREVARSATRAAVAPPALRPAAAPAVRPVRRPAAPRVADRPAASAFAGALAPGTPALPNDLFAMAVSYTGTLAALSR